MELYNLERTLESLFDQLCYQQTKDIPWQQAKNFGIYFRLQVRCDNNGYEKDGNTRHEDWQRTFTSMIHIIVLAHKRLYMARADYTSPTKEIRPEHFKNISNHDTCWKDAMRDRLQRVYFDAYHACWDHVPEEHSIAPIQAGISFCMVPLFLTPFRYVMVERAKLEDFEESNHGYFDRLTKIGYINHTINFDLTNVKEIVYEKEEATS